MSVEGRHYAAYIMRCGVGPGLPRAPRHFAPVCDPKPGAPQHNQPQRRDARATRRCIGGRVGAKLLERRGVIGCNDCLVWATPGIFSLPRQWVTAGIRLVKFSTSAMTAFMIGRESLRRVHYDH